MAQMGRQPYTKDAVTRFNLDVWRLGINAFQAIALYERPFWDGDEFHDFLIHPASLAHPIPTGNPECPKPT